MGSLASSVTGYCAFRRGVPSLGSKATVSTRMSTQAQLTVSGVDWSTPRFELTVPLEDCQLKLEFELTENTGKISKTIVC